MSFRYLSRRVHTSTDNLPTCSASTEVLCSTPEPGITPRRKYLRFGETTIPIKPLHRSTESLVGENRQPTRSILRKSISVTNLHGGARKDVTYSKSQSSMYLSRTRIIEDGSSEMIPRMENFDQTKTLVCDVRVNTDVSVPPGNSRIIHSRISVPPQNWQRPQRTYKSFKELIAAMPVEKQAALTETIKKSQELFRRARFGLNTNGRR